MEFRIGINLGDVMVEGEQIYGDGVNVAARLESLAEPGGICISGTVHEQIGNKLALGYEDLGEQAVKNIAKPVRVYRVLAEGGARTRRFRSAKGKYVRRGVFSLAGLAIIAAMIVLVQHLSLRPQATHASIPAPRKPALALPSVPSIAVLPFANLSGDASQEYFSDGITDDIITDLSRIPILFVIARSSSFTYKGKAERVEQIGRELGGKYLLEGSVRKLGDQVRINVQLVDATTGKEVWANRYDRQMRDIFKLQDEIVQGLITTLGLQLSLLEKGLIVPQRTNNLEAYDYFLRAFEGSSVFSREGFAYSRRMFEKAVALDPDYADAYAFLGFLRMLEYLWQWDSSPRTLDQAEQLARRAASLDDSTAVAYAVLGWVAALRNRPNEAIADGNRAIALEPNNAFCYIALADILEIIGRDPAQALSYAQKAMRLDPKHPEAYAFQIGVANLGMNRHREAVDALRVAEVAQPNNPHIHLNLCYAYTRLGRDQDAQAEAAEVTRAAPGFTVEMLKKSLPATDWNTPGGRHFLDALRKAGLK